MRANLGTHLALPEGDDDDHMCHESCVTSLLWIPS